MTDDVIVVHNEPKGKEWIGRLMGKSPIFICAIGTTETAKIPKISAAGKTPEITDYTPAADVELLLHGRCRCMEGVPITPDGIPTPALITMSVLELTNIPTFVVVGGARIKPHTPFIDLGGTPGKDIRTGKAVENVGEVLERAEICGRNFAKCADYLVIGESIPGGTTTALGVMMGMGIDARRKVSSSMPRNPHDLKVKTVEQGMRAAGVRFGELKEDPSRAVACVGDPMIPAVAGVAIGAAQEIPVMLAGGTQMGAVLSVIKTLRPHVLRNLAIATTRWITEDRTADLKGIITQIADVPILAANLDFSGSELDGLRAYEAGVVKEGVGAGGTAVSAILKTRGRITCAMLMKEVEKNYRRLLRRA